jgi:hypothetical protein
MPEEHFVNAVKTAERLAVRGDIHVNASLHPSAKILATRGGWRNAAQHTIRIIM